MMLTGITHRKSYSGTSEVAGHLTDKGIIFVHSHGPFGNLPQYLGVEQARAMFVVLQAIVYEHDRYQAALTAEYGPPLPVGA